MRLEKAKSRDNQTEQQKAMQKVYSKRYRVRHYEKCLERQRKYRRKKNGVEVPFQNCLPYKLFGKHIKDFSDEEMKIFRHERYVFYRSKKDGV